MHGVCHRLCRYRTCPAPSQNRTPFCTVLGHYDRTPRNRPEIPSVLLGTSSAVDASMHTTRNGQKAKRYTVLLLSQDGEPETVARPVGYYVSGIEARRVADEMRLAVTGEASIVLYDRWTDTYL